MGLYGMIKRRASTRFKVLIIRQLTTKANCLQLEKDLFATIAILAVMRKSTLGTHGLPPIRLDLTNVSPLLLNANAKPGTPFLAGKTPHSRRKLGSSKKKRLPPIRLNQLDFSKVSHKSRRCLDYRDDRSQFSSSSSRRTPQSKNETFFKVPNTQKRNVANDASRTKIPKGVSSTKIPRKTSNPGHQNKPSTKPSQWTDNTTAASSSSGHQESQSNILEKLLDEQRKALAGAGQEIKSMFEEQRKALAEEYKKMLDEQKQVLAQSLVQFKEEVRLIHETSKQVIFDFISKYEGSKKKSTLKVMGENELAPCSSSSQSEVNELKGVCSASRRSTRKSLKAYKDMKEQFQCLRTPSLSAKKSKTPRSKTPMSRFSRRLQTQLESLYDD